MPHYAYVNGRYLPHTQASVHIEDRGFQFADAVYEVIPVLNCALIDQEAHYDRLAYSLRELDIPWPMTRQAMRLVTRELLRKNALNNGIVYQQISRGQAGR
ncbi:MAG: aminotransferase class IV, partial [Pseudomonadota bacterium]